MNGFRQNITRIKGLSDRRRLPRLGIIRLGIKLKSQSTGNEYPKETDYFVCPDEVKAVYGDQPKEIDIMVPLNDPDAVFPMAYKHYGSSRGLICSGDGEKAYRVNTDTGEMEQIECPCVLLEQGKCKQSATFMFMIPKVSLGGIYQVRTSSFNSIIDLQSGLDFIQALIGRFAMIPLKLRRIKTQTHHEGKKQYHYTMQVIFPGNIDTINQLKGDTEKILAHPQYALPAPLDENPELDPVDIVVADEEDSANPLDIANNLKDSMSDIETTESLKTFYTQKYEVIASLPAEIKQDVMDYLNKMYEKITLPATLSIDDRFHKEFIFHKHESTVKKITEGIKVLVEEINTTEERVKEVALEDPVLFKKEIERVATTTPPIPTTDPVSETSGPQNEEEIPPPGEEDLPPEFGENSLSGEPSSREKAIISAKEMLDSVPSEQREKFWTDFKRTMQFEDMPIDDQEEVRAYYEKLSVE